LYPHTVAGTRDSIGALSARLGRGSLYRKWRFHDEMQAAIRRDQQREVLIASIVAVSGAGSGDIEDPLRVFEQEVHARYLSAGISGFLRIVRPWPVHAGNS
jgi:hypothetical protein